MARSRFTDCFGSSRGYTALSDDSKQTDESVPKSALPSHARTVGLVLLAIIYSSALVLLGTRLSQPCAPAYDHDSPIFSSVRPSLSKIQYNNTFWPRKADSIFRQPPSDAVDQAWERISNTRDIVITRDEVLALGKDPGVSVRADPSWGFGDEAYLALVHGMHQNHCLNNLRKAVYYNYYYRQKRGFGANPPDDYRAKYYAHMDHCIEFLRLDIACKADVSVSTYRWMEGESAPVADFNTWHSCRDFDHLVDWQAKRDINAGFTTEEQDGMWRHFGPKEDDVIVPQEREANASYWDVNMWRE